MHCRFISEVEWERSRTYTLFFLSFFDYIEMGNFFTPKQMQPIVEKSLWKWKLSADKLFEF